MEVDGEKRDEAERGGVSRNETGGGVRAGNGDWDTLKSPGSCHHGTQSPSPLAENC